MTQSLQIRQEKEASFTDFLLYFLRLGAVGFGGPIALASRMESDLVADRGWIERQDYLEGLAFAQLAPGPLAAQLAMYLGYRAGWSSGRNFSSHSLRCAVIPYGCGPRCFLCPL